MVKGYDFFDIEAREMDRGAKIKAVYYGTRKKSQINLERWNGFARSE
ncbi:hypothetical protein [Bacillus sp. JJ722]